MSWAGGVPCRLSLFKSVLPFSSASLSSSISGCSDRSVAGEKTMNAVVKPQQGQIVEAGQMTAEIPAHLTTTLYDVIAALQSVVETDEDGLVVAVVGHWLRTGRITYVGDATVAA
jgi:hypothetical protein